MIDFDRYLKYLQEFSHLIKQPSNTKYVVGDRKLDYTSLACDSIICDLDDVEPDHGQRILYVNSVLSQMLSETSKRELEELGNFLRVNNYAVRIEKSNFEIHFIVVAPNYDYLVIID